MRSRGLASLALFFFASGLSSFGLASSYVSGSELCSPQSPAIEDEFGFWVQSKDTKIYAWTNTPFSRQKKTVVFINGGPGDQSHESALSLDAWNVVFFDQRGISCSRPETGMQYRDQSFYSSEKTVRDIEAIRQHLKLEKISLYGVSYGTVPAHLYAHHYPEHTRALVLEGVIAQSDAQTLIENPHRRKMLQDFFDSLPENLQDRILELSRQGSLPASWFSQIGKMMFYLDQPEAAFRQFLESTVWQEDSLKDLMPGFTDHLPAESEFGSGTVAFQMISCQEMGLNTSGVSFNSVFVGKTLMPEKNNFVREIYCAPLGFQADRPTNVFRASRFPLRVPVTYVQGSMDGSTAPWQAHSSYEQAAKGPAQLISIDRGGHQPLQGPLASGYEKGPRTNFRKELLSATLEAHQVSLKLLEKLSTVTEMKWSRKTKKF